LGVLADTVQWQVKEKRPFADLADRENSAISRSLNTAKIWDRGGQGLDGELDQFPEQLAL
jgi:hypothetical protein